jgi:hypothetical protein
MRSVFFSTAGMAAICGSHAPLVALAAVHPLPRQKSHPFRWGYPGISTPYDSVYRLPPNCEFSLSSGRVLRFFPDTLIPEVRIEDAWNLAFNRAGVAIKALAARHKLLVSLTAGLDSRTTLAATRDSWSQLLFFTYDRGDHKHQIDFGVAHDLSATLGLRHIRVRYSAHESKQLSKLLAGHTFTSHQRTLACAYHRQFGEGNYLHIRSNLLELARSNLFFKFGKRQRFEPPDTAGRMGAFYNRAAKLAPDRAGHVIPAFEHYVAVTDYGSTLGRASPWDLYFVEHRMGAWHSGAVLESDVSFDTVIAFNSREIVRHFMGVPQEVRSSSTCLREKLKILLPEVVDIPVNPRWYSKRPAA